MPGTDQTTIKVQRPQGGTWDSFLLQYDTFMVTSDHVNHPENYINAEDEWMDISKRVKKEQSDHKTYLDLAKESFEQIYGPSKEGENFFTKETVQQAMDRTYVNGQPYKERFRIDKITEDNYELAMCHLYYQLTTGDIAGSYERDPQRMYGEAMKVTVLNTSGEKDKLFTAVVPQEPSAVEKPHQPSGWKRFWNRFGFYKKDIQTYNDHLKWYNDYVENKHEYEENVRKTQEEAADMGEKLINQNRIPAERKEQVYTAMQDQTKRAELHEAAKEVMPSIPKTDADSQQLEIRKYIDNYDPNRFTQKPFLSGMGRGGSLATQLLAYTATVNNMSIDDAVNASETVKKEAGKQFKELFLDEIPTGKKNKENTAKNEANTAENEEEMKRIHEQQMEQQMNKAADAMAKIYQHCGKEQLNAVDVLSPESIRENAVHNIRVGLVGMDMGQMLNINNHPLADKIAQKMGGMNKLKEVKNAFAAARTASDPLKSLCTIYGSDEFLNSRVTGNIKRPNDAATDIVIPGSKNPAHIQENFDLFDFALTNEEMAQIAAMNKKKRYYTSTPELLKAYAEMVPDVDGQK